MSFLLDTNILSAHLRRPTELAHRFFQYSGRLYTSSVCLGELYVWAYGRKDPAPMLASIERLLEHEVSLIDFDRDCAQRFGSERIGLRRKGIEVSTADLMIGCVALEYDLTLVTHNTADFRNIPSLRLVDWLIP
jgi:tRNA(fMet)-specific endonuclease VapC